jgi:hypothetical protein
MPYVQSGHPKFEGQRAGRILVGAAVEMDPAELYSSLRHPTYDDLPFLVAREVGGQVEYAVAEKAHKILSLAIRDTGMYLLKGLRHHEFSGTFDEALSFAQHDRTIDGIANFARLRTSSSYYHIFSSKPGRSYHVDPHSSEPAIVPTYPSEPEDGGCPAAGTEKDPTKPTPLFRKFVPWAGELALRCAYDSGSLVYPASVINYPHYA